STLDYLFTEIFEIPASRDFEHSAVERPSLEFKRVIKHQLKIAGACGELNRQGIEMRIGDLSAGIRREPRTCPRMDSLGRDRPGVNATLLLGDTAPVCPLRVARLDVVGEELRRLRFADKNAERHSRQQPLTRNVKYEIDGCAARDAPGNREREWSQAFGVLARGDGRKIRSAGDHCNPSRGCR